MNNLIAFPQTAAFFLPAIGRCLPGLTDVAIELATMVQRAEIEQELLRLRLRQKCFLALARANALEALIFPAGGSDQVAHGEGNDPSAKPVVTHPPVASRSSIKIFPGGSVGDGFKPESSSAPPLPCLNDSNHSDATNQRTARVFDANNPYPKGRW